MEGVQPHSLDEQREKASALRQQSLEIQRVFNLPESECVIQSYHCGVWKRVAYIQGRLYITQNHLVFRGSLGAPLKRNIKLLKVQGVQRTTSMLVQSALEVVMEDGKKHHFGTFLPGKGGEALAIIQHLLAHPPRIVEDDDLEEEREREREMEREELHHAHQHSPSTPAFGNANDAHRSNPFASAEALPAASRSASLDRGSGGRQQQAYARVEVDTQASKRALAKALEARETGAATMEELQRQRNVMTRMEGKLDEIDVHMDQSARHLRAVESLGGAFLNKLSHQKAEKEAHERMRRIQQSVSAPQPQIKVKRIEAHFFVDILYKASNDSLHPALLRFGPDTFEVMNSNGKELFAPELRWSYEAIASIVMRTRQLHLDVRFKDTRLRLMSSHIQVIVNEFALRLGLSSKAGAPPPRSKVKVEFEPGVAPFPYGEQKISRVITTAASRKDYDPFATVSRDRGASDFTNSIKDDKIRRQLQEQDDDLDAISDVMHDLHEMAVTLNEEVLPEDIARLKRLNQRVESASDRVEGANDRVQRLL